MTGELRTGKRTFIHHADREFELPDQHEIKVYDSSGELPHWVMLATPQMGGRYVLEGIDETPDRVTVRVGELLDGQGWGTFGPD